MGKITANFLIPRLSFNYHGQVITLICESQLLPASHGQLKRLLHTNSVNSLHMLSFLPVDDRFEIPPNPDSLITPESHNILSQFKLVFDKPTTLAPHRAHDHHIHLDPNSKPVNIKPYRYPHYQKAIMIDIIKEFLQTGLIRPSTSPFSSPVLLVSKKDETWHFCADYRGLNAITVKDKFPIPTVDELLDELKGATIFTKLDLRSGYHQIRVAQKDIH